MFSGSQLLCCCCRRNSRMKDGGPLVLMYHRIGRPASRHKAGGQYVGTHAFARQMDLLRRMGTPVVRLDAVARHVRGEEYLSSQHLAITFDDGFANLHSNAFPALKKHQFPATVFLISRYIGKTNTYHAPEQDLFEPMLSVEQIQEMMASGVEFGSHTQHHVHLTACSSGELSDEISGSRHDLEELLRRRVPSFCYPYGDQDDRVRQAVVDAGYESACSTLKGRNNRGEDPYRLRRINIRADTLLPVFLFKLARARWFNR